MAKLLGIGEKGAGKDAIPPLQPSAPTGEKTSEATQGLVGAYLDRRTGMIVYHDGRTEPCQSMEDLAAGLDKIKLVDDEDSTAANGTLDENSKPHLLNLDENLRRVAQGKKGNMGAAITEILALINDNKVEFRRAAAESRQAAAETRALARRMADLAQAVEELATTPREEGPDAYAPEDRRRSTSTGGNARQQAPRSISANPLSRAPIKMDRRREGEKPMEFLRGIYRNLKNCDFEEKRVNEQLQAVLARDEEANWYVDPIDGSLWKGLEAMCKESSVTAAEIAEKIVVKVDPKEHSEYGLPLVNSIYKKFDCVAPEERDAVSRHVARLLTKALDPYAPGISREVLKFRNLIDTGKRRELGKEIEWILRGWLETYGYKSEGTARRFINSVKENDRQILTDSLLKKGLSDKNPAESANALYQGAMMQEANNTRELMEKLTKSMSAIQRAVEAKKDDGKWRGRQPRDARRPEWRDRREGGGDRRWQGRQARTDKNFQRNRFEFRRRDAIVTDELDDIQTTNKAFENYNCLLLPIPKSEKGKPPERVKAAKLANDAADRIKNAAKKWHPSDAVARFADCAKTAMRFKGKDAAARLYKLFAPLGTKDRHLLAVAIVKESEAPWKTFSIKDKLAHVKRLKACEKLCKKAANRESGRQTEATPPPPAAPQAKAEKQKLGKAKTRLRTFVEFSGVKSRKMIYNPTYTIVGTNQGESLHEETIRKIERMCHEPETLTMPVTKEESRKDEQMPPRLPDAPPEAPRPTGKTKGPKPRDDTGKGFRHAGNNYIPAVINGAPASCLHDTGASINTIPRRFVDEWSLANKIYSGSPLRVTTGNGPITIRERLNLRVMFQNWILDTVFFVSPDAEDRDVILGTATTDPGPSEEMWVITPNDKDGTQVAHMNGKPVTHLFKSKQNALRAARWLARQYVDDRTEIPLFAEANGTGHAKVRAARTYWKSLADSKWLMESADGTTAVTVTGNDLKEGVELPGKPGTWGSARIIIAKNAARELGLEPHCAGRPVDADFTGGEPRLRKACKTDIPPTTIVRHTPSKEEIEQADKARSRRRQKHDDRGREAFLKPFKEIDPSLSEKADEVLDVVWEYRDVFGESINDCKEGFLNYKVDLGFTTNNLPKPRFMNQGPVKKAALKRYLEVYEQAGVVSRTTGEAYSNAFLIKKPNHIKEGQNEMDDETFAKQWRLICDLSAVNRNISTFATEPQTITSILEQYKPHELQCSVDILACFHQVNLTDRCKPVTTFAGAGHNWKMNKLPMGGVNSINVLQAILDEIFADLGRDVKSFLIYVDDLILTAKSPEEMADRLREFLEICRKENVVLKWTKSVLLRKDDIKILGFSISKDKLKPQKEKLEQAELKLKEIKTQKELRALLASLNYYRCFTHRFSYLAQPLHALTLVDKKDFEFRDKHRKALETLVEEIKSTPGLNFLNDAKIKNGEYKIYADASTSAMGGLITATANGTEYPLSFHSKTFPEEYRIKHINILETLAFNMMVRKFKGYICGRKVSLVTDSQYFKRVMDQQHDKQQLLPTNVLRWITEIRQECHPSEIILVKSGDNPADFLTRFTDQNQITPLDTPFLAAGFDINGSYEPGFTEEPLSGESWPGHLELRVGGAPILGIIATALNIDEKCFRTKFFEFMKGYFSRQRANIKKLYGAPKTKDVCTFIRTISAKDWSLGHPELEALANMTGICIKILDEDSTAQAGCKYEKVYGGGKEREIKIFRTTTGQASLISDTERRMRAIRHLVDGPRTNDEILNIGLEHRIEEERAYRRRVPRARLAPAPIMRPSAMLPADTVMVGQNLHARPANQNRRRVPGPPLEAPTEVDRDEAAPPNSEVTNAGPNGDNQSFREENTPEQTERREAGPPSQEIQPPVRTAGPPNSPDRIEQVQPTVPEMEPETNEEIEENENQIEPTIQEATNPPQVTEIITDSTIEASVEIDEIDLEEDLSNNVRRDSSIMPMRTEIKSWQNDCNEIKDAKEIYKNHGAGGLRTHLEAGERKSLTPTQAFLLRNVDDLEITKDGILCVIGFTATSRSTRYIIPQQNLKEVVKRIHEKLGHPGRDRSAYLAAQYIAAPNMVNSCGEMVLECDRCRRATDEMQFNETESRPTAARIPWESLSIDVMHLPPSGGYNHVLVASDNASAYTWAIPLRRADAQHVIKALDANIFLLHGNYLEVNFDGATSLNGEEMRSILNVLDMSGRRILVSRKNSNRAERDIGRIRQALRKTLNDDPNKWINALPYLMLTLNATPITGWKTNMSPHELQFGNRPRLIEAPDEESYECLADYAQRRADNQQEAQKQIVEQRFIRHRLTKRGNRFRNPKKIKTGDEVYARRDLLKTGAAPTQNKVKTIYTGPHKVIEARGNHYVININGKRSLYHRRRLKLKGGDSDDFRT